MFPFWVNTNAPGTARIVSKATKTDGTFRLSGVVISSILIKIENPI
jgi:hypothetical protein